MKGGRGIEQVSNLFATSSVVWRERQKKLGSSQVQRLVSSVECQPLPLRRRDISGSEMSASASNSFNSVLGTQLGACIARNWRERKMAYDGPGVEE